MSPHLQIWRWHVTMLGSILHRVTGVGLCAGTALVVVWLGCVAAGPECYAAFLALASSPLGLLVWLALSAAAFYHLFAGVRHLIWDSGLGFEPKVASNLTTASILLAIVSTIGFWAWLFIEGRVSL
jgi:succinate dehydrogenase / fumarate reductase cytochrome b subunit